MVTINVNGTPRAEVGKASTKAARKSGLIPCVLYGNDGENLHFTVKPHDVRDLVYTGEFKIAELEVDGKKYRSILKELQFHPVKDTIQHIDFLELQSDRKIKVEVPIRFEGVSPGVRNGGKFQQSVRKIKIKTKLEYLVDHLVVDISALKLGASLRVRDIQTIEGIEIMNPGAQPIASVAVPRVLKGADAGEDEEEGTEEGAEATEEAAAAE